MPAVRGIVREAARQDYRFSALVIGHREERAVPDAAKSKASVAEVAPVTLRVVTRGP